MGSRLSLYQSLKHWPCCLCSNLLIQFITFITKSLDAVHNIATYRHQLIEGRGMTLLVLRQKTHLLIRSWFLSDKFCLCSSTFWVLARDFKLEIVRGTPQIQLSERVHGALINACASDWTPPKYVTDVRSSPFLDDHKRCSSQIRTQCENPVNSSFCDVSHPSPWDLQLQLLAWTWPLRVRFRGFRPK